MSSLSGTWSTCIHTHTLSQHSEYDMLKTNTHTFLRNKHYIILHKLLQSPTLFLEYGKLNSRIPLRHYDLLFTATTLWESVFSDLQCCTVLHSVQNPDSFTCVVSPPPFKQLGVPCFAFFKNTLISYQCKKIQSPNPWNGWKSNCHLIIARTSSQHFISSLTKRCVHVTSKYVR